MKKFLLFSIFFTCLTFASTGQSKMQYNFKETSSPVIVGCPNSNKLDSLFNALAAANQGMGSIAISKNGNLLYCHAIGYELIKGRGKDTATEKTKYRIGSITKMFTAVIIFQLIEEGLFPLAWYANRDSISYIDTYALHDVSTFIRTTLRYPSFCRGWSKIVTLGLTDKNDVDEIKNCKTFSDWFDLKKSKLDLKNKNDFFNDEFLEQIDYLGMRTNGSIPVEHSNSASILQFLL